jgi:hypothetical protein
LNDPQITKQQFDEKRRFFREICKNLFIFNAVIDKKKNW